jgi:sirohydrochlorin ferrochelatase
LRKEFIDSGQMAAHAFAPFCLLFDNGSLRPESTLNLRTIARRLQVVIGTKVQAVSLLHSSAVAPSELGGVPAQVLEPALDALLAAGVNGIVLLPLFFGPSAALTEFLPARLEHLRRIHPAMRVRVGQWLVDASREQDARIAAILAGKVRAVIAAFALDRPNVVLVDHGSPQRGVAEVRHLLGRQLRALLGKAVGQLAVASMERRAGPEYDFSGPLLATVLGQPGFCQGNLVLAQQFLSPGRHAGSGGDVARICAAAEQAHRGLKIHPTDLIGGDPQIVDVLADRYGEARLRPPF